MPLNEKSKEQNQRKKKHRFVILIEPLFANHAAWSPVPRNNSKVKTFKASGDGRSPVIASGGVCFAHFTPWDVKGMSIPRITDSWWSRPWRTPRPVTREEENGISPNNWFLLLFLQAVVQFLLDLEGGTILFSVLTIVFSLQIFYLDSIAIDIGTSMILK